MKLVFSAPIKAKQNKDFGSWFRPSALPVHRLGPDKRIMKVCSGWGFVQAKAADRMLVSPALEGKWYQLSSDNEALVWNSCPGEMAQCCLTVAHMLHGYVWDYLTEKEPTRWNWALLTRNAVSGCGGNSGSGFSDSRIKYRFVVLGNLSLLPELWTTSM